MSEFTGKRCDIYGTTRKVVSVRTTCTLDDGTPAVDDKGVPITDRVIDYGDRGWKRFCSGMRQPIEKAKPTEVQA